ncbi:hypothetical protein HYT02_04285 [Candidatus Gottesmanbacteria bacterium]|nr:hypothetical protein [Candidatus Gottesmanbacteria bacterium]
MLGISRIVWVLLLALVILLLIGINVIFKKSNWNTTPTPTVVAIPLEDVLFPTKTQDDLPQNTLEIPSDKWGEKFDALGQRVLDYFQDQSVAPKELPNDKVELYQAFVKAWGKPWRVHYLTTNFTKEELQLIWDQVLIVQANTPEELEKQKQIVTETLNRVKPSAQLPESTKVEDHFATQQDVERAIEEAKLVELKTVNIQTAEKAYTVKPLAQLTQEVDQRLALYKNVLEISSATRFLKLQTLLKEKLGYLAAKISYHTKGAAIDLKLSQDGEKRFDDYMKEEINGKTPRLEMVTSFYKQGTPLTIANLVKFGVLDKNQELGKVLAIVEETMAGKGVEIIDETFFGIRLDKEGNVIDLNPVLHLQYTQ